MKIRLYISRLVRSTRGAEARQASMTARLLPGGFNVLREFADDHP
jgi:hypothetical protein